jgi:coproporphyrinogen III oxidase-like Fe-S oxidoreductase
MLELEPRVPLYRALDQGLLSLPDQDEVADWYLATQGSLQDAGYRQYEISNFSRDGKECRHNLKYWQRVPVIGFGAGSHSFDGRCRYANEPDLLKYIEAVEAGHPPVSWHHALTEDEKLEETLFLGLRLTQGVDWSRVEQDSSSACLRTCEEILSRLGQCGLVEWEDRQVRLTARGMLLSNEVFQQFIDLAECRL